jgi:hypothetical protein
MRRLYRKHPRHYFAIFLLHFAMPAARRAPVAGLQWQQPQRRTRMTKQPPIAVEIAAQISLALAIGLFVSVVLAGITLLLAA